MKLVSVVTALQLVLPATGAAFPARPARAYNLFQSANRPAEESRTPAVVIGSKDERAAKAAANYAQNRTVEAALGFEGLYKDYPSEVDYLFNAAASRYAAGHYAHVVAYTREYLAAPTLGPEDRKEADAQLQEALPQVSPVTVAVTAAPGGSAAITVVAQHIARESGDLRPELLFPAQVGAPIELQLDPGSWSVRAQGPGYVEVEQRIEVTKGGKTAVNLRLELAPVAPTVDPAAPPPAREVPPALVRRLELGFGVAGGLVAVTGVAVLAVGGRKVGGAADCGDNSYVTCTQSLRDGVRVRDIGTMTLGGGLGLMTGGLTWLARDARTRRTAWIAEMAVGGAMLVGGAVLNTVSARNFNVANNAGAIDSWKQHYDAHHASAGHGIGGFLFGAGVGLLVSAATGFAVQKKHLGKNLRVDALSGRGQAGLTLSGRF